MKFTRIFPTVAVVVAIGCSSGAMSETWEPPTSPDPRVILTEARDDRKNERYAISLEKHIWFHESALKYRPSLYGVRLSFALADWKKLADQYPPALEQLKQIRDNSEWSVKESDEDFDVFHDFVGINRVLGDEDRTTSMFKWLDLNKPSVADSAYTVAENALVAAGQYVLCGKYIGGIDSYYDYEYRYRRGLRPVEGRPFSDLEIELQRKNYSYQVALLIAILVKNNKSDAASEIANRVLRDWDGHVDKQQIRDAQNGVVPEILF